LTGKIAVITGANRGIGLETARTLASMGAHVIMTCRSLSKCQPLVDDINSDNKIAGSAAAAVLDLRRLKSAAMLASELREAYANIDYIFCNAGTTPQFELTEDGFEDAFGEFGSCFIVASTYLC
jgi:NAD(P)-dependent dehydrogenase (short-subunit alcohol dehydrogenase family)